MKVIRLIVYETNSETQMAEQIGMSLPDGIKKFNGMKITTCTMGNRPMMEIINKFEGGRK